MSHRRCLLAGSWLNMLLFALEIVFFAYHMRRRNLSYVFKCAVLLVILNDALGTVCGCAYVYYFLVDLARVPQWPLAVVLVSTGFSAFTEQSYLIVRPAFVDCCGC